MKRLLLVGVVFLLLLPALATARPTTLLVYKGTQKLVGHEFDTVSAAGPVWKEVDSVYLVMYYEPSDPGLVNTGYLITIGKGADGKVGEYTPIYNLSMAFDLTSARQSATLYSFDAWGDPAQPFAFVLQGQVGEVFTGVDTMPIPKTLAGNSVSRSLLAPVGPASVSAAIAIESADVCSGTMKLKFDKTYTLPANANFDSTLATVLNIVADLESKGVTFLTEPPPI